MPKRTTRKELIERLRMPELSHFSKHLGFEILEAGEGRCVVGVEVRDEHTNLSGIAHGGLASSLLDTAMGGAVVSTLEPEEWCATLQLGVSYLAAIPKGRVTAVGEVSKRGKRVAFAEGRATDAEGKALAVAHGTWHVWLEGE